MPRRRRPARPGALADLSPTRIATQIVLLQALYYFVAAILIVFTHLVSGERIHIALLFDWRQLRGDITPGWTLALCWMIDSLVWSAVLYHERGFLLTASSVIFLLLLIARSKLVPDFVLTIHGINLFITTLYSKQLPSTLFWWGLQAASSALMIFLGIWACQWRELKPMAFGGHAHSKTKTVDESTTMNGPESIGLLGGGSARGGTGAYEMASIAPDAEQG